jgi:hypothetical protein
LGPRLTSRARLAGALHGSVREADWLVTRNKRRADLPSQPATSWLTVGRIAPHAWPIATKTANITDVRRLRALSRYRLRHIGAEACELSVFAVAISARFSLFAAGTRVAHEHTALLIWDADPVITEHTAEAHHYDSETVVLTRRVHGWKFVWSWFPD